MENKVVDCVEWNPNKEICLIAVANEELVYFISPELYSRETNQKTRDLIETADKAY
jgi:hypothetical protein